MDTESALKAHRFGSKNLHLKLMDPDPRICTKSSWIRIRCFEVLYDLSRGQEASFYSLEVLYGGFSQTI